MSFSPIIVIGTSAGGVEALQRLVKDLNPTLPATVVIVMHLAADHFSQLPEILSRANTLPVSLATEGEQMNSGQIYVAPHGKHLLVVGNRFKLTTGAKENGFRPAIDPLFRSAALAFRSRTIGVLLSGLLHDGVSGLRAIKAAGGLAIVQDPQEALFSNMIDAAIDTVDVDSVLPLAQIAAFLNEYAANFHKRAASNRDRIADLSNEKLAKLELDVQTAAGSAAGSAEINNQLGALSEYGCPACAGVLWEISEKNNTRFRCRVGHSFSAQGLSSAQQSGSESALWSAVRVLEEKLSLNRRLSERMIKNGQSSLSTGLEADSLKTEQQIEAIKLVIQQGFSPEERSST